MTVHEFHAIVAAAVSAVVTFFLYLAHCIIRPKRACWLCKGTPGRDLSGTGKTWRDCWWCDGAGFRWRYGKRIYDRCAGKKVKR